MILDLSIFMLILCILRMTDVTDVTGWLDWLDASLRVFMSYFLSPFPGHLFQVFHAEIPKLFY